MNTTRWIAKTHAFALAALCTLALLVGIDNLALAQHANAAVANKAQALRTAGSAAAPSTGSAAGTATTGTAALPRC